MNQMMRNILNRRTLHRVERRSPVLTVPAYRPHSCNTPAKSLLCFRSLPHPPRHFCLSSQFLNLHLTFSNTNYISFASRNGIFWFYFCCLTAQLDLLKGRVSFSGYWQYVLEAWRNYFRTGLSVKDYPRKSLGRGKKLCHVTQCNT